MENNERSVVARRGPRPGEALPYFELPGSQNGPLSPWRFKGRRNLVLVFTGDDECEPCRQLLRGFAQRYRDFVAEEAEVLGVVPVSRSRAQQMAQTLGLPFPLLADEDGSVRLRYGAQGGGDLVGVVYVADRFGELHERWLVEPGQPSLPVADEALARLRFLEIQCPECGAPEWPPA